MKRIYDARAAERSDSLLLCEGSPDSLMDTEVMPDENSDQDSEGISTNRPCDVFRSFVSRTKSCFS
jgi:hypothetical protein